MSTTLFISRDVTRIISRDASDMCPRWSCVPPLTEEETRCPPPAESIVGFRLRDASDVIMQRVSSLIQLLEGRALIVLSVPPDQLEELNERIAAMGNFRTEGISEENT